MRMRLRHRAPSIRFVVLGPMEVWFADRLLHVPGGMPRRLLAILLARAGEAVSLDGLIDELWGGRPPRTARKTVQVYLHHLRRILPEPNRITLTSAGYTLTVATGELDAQLFESLITRAAAAGPEAAGRLLNEALQLWRGTPFAGLAELPSVIRRRDELTERRLIAVEEHARLELADGRHTELVPPLRAVAAEHPYRETLQEHLMAALYLGGRQAEAIDVYQALRHRLDEELGVEPVRTVQDLYRVIVRGEPLAAPGRPMLLPRDVLDPPRTSQPRLMSMSRETPRW